MDNETGEREGDGGERSGRERPPLRKRGRERKKERE